jgi:hypothetical protein
LFIFKVFFSLQIGFLIFEIKWFGFELQSSFNEIWSNRDCNILWNVGVGILQRLEEWAIRNREGSKKFWAKLNLNEIENPRE